MIPNFSISKSSLIQPRSLGFLERDRTSFSPLVLGNSKAILKSHASSSTVGGNPKFTTGNYSALLRQDALNLSNTILPSAKVKRDLAAGVKIATIQLKYQGFVPKQVQLAFQYAANIWQTQIRSRVPLQLQVRWKKLNQNVLGLNLPILTSFSKSQEKVQKETWYTSALANKFVGEDVFSSLPDAVISLNRNIPWYLGKDGKPTAGAYDLVTVAMHEIHHSLVNSSTMDYESLTLLGGWGFSLGTRKPYPGQFDHFVVNGLGQRILNTKSFPNPSQALGKQLTSNDLFFNGANALKANGGIYPKLFAPTVWQNGSSYAHLDEFTYPAGNPNSLSTPAIGAAEVIHQLGPIGQGILKDLGWKAAP